MAVFVYGDTTDQEVRCSSASKAAKKLFSRDQYRVLHGKRGAHCATCCLADGLINNNQQQQCNANWKGKSLAPLLGRVAEEEGMDF
jgi:hypothetical protein